MLSVAMKSGKSVKKVSGVCNACSTMAISSVVTSDFKATYSTNFLQDREEMPAGKAALMAATVAAPRLVTMAAWSLVRACSHFVYSPISYTNLANAGAEDDATDVGLRGIVIVGRARIVGGWVVVSMLLGCESQSKSRATKCRAPQMSSSVR